VPASFKRGNMRKKEKTYFVMWITRTDEDYEMRHLNAQGVKELIDKIGQEGVIIFEGNLVKGPNSKMDLSKL